MKTTESDLLAELRRVHEEYHPPLQPGEFTANQYGQAQDPPVNAQGAAAEMIHLVRTGVFEKVEDRYVAGRMRPAYRIVKPG